MSLFEWMEFLSYTVTVVGLPLAIGVFLYEQQKERHNEEEEIYQRLSDEYADFLRLALDHADLKLFQRQPSRAPLSDEQQERKSILFGILVSLFERAYLLVYEEDMSKKQRRLWLSWEDYIREWCRRADFRDALEQLLEGEDAEFRELIQKIAGQEAAAIELVPE